MNLKILKTRALVATLLLLSGCAHLSSNTIRNPSVAQCEIDPEAPRLFNVIQNDQNQVIVELGPFISFFKLSGTYQYKVIFENQLVQTEQVTDDHYRVTLPVKQTGIYEFTIFQSEGSPFWKQKVFVIAPQDHTLSEGDKQQLAETFAPVVKYHDEENYFPVSLEYMLNEVEVDSNLIDEPFQLTNKLVPQGFFSFLGSKNTDLNLNFKFKDIRKILPFYGHSDSVLKSGLEQSSGSLLKQRYGRRFITVYYSVFENPKYNEIYINYHFFYSYDPKNGTVKNESIAAHILDRESMTVVLRGTSRKPLAVFYGAHLAGQNLAQLDRDGNILQRWSTGRVFVNWPETNKVGNQPVAYAALGSHAFYPVPGTFSVMLNSGGQIRLLTEPVGGERTLLPPSLKAQATSSTSFLYDLKNLRLDSVTSDCQNTANILTFSGSTVDVLGPTNATFPPFTDREEDYKNYLDPNAPLFDMKADKTLK